MKWKNLQHNGIVFPPEYETRGIKIKVKGETVNLTLKQEEMAYQWGKKKDTPYAKDKVFQKNFATDFAKALGPKFKKISYQDIDFSEAYKVAEDETKDKDEKKKKLKGAKNKAKRKALALRKKKLREKMKAEYGTATMTGKDGKTVEVEVGNYMAEPPGIFIGRGAHPLRGKWKPRITEKDVTLNLGKNAKVPKGNWKKIIHENDTIWLANWTDFLTQKTKYVWLADTAGPKQERDREKYEKAVKLSNEIDKIKDRIVKDMKNPKKRKIATACYLIYRTAMRVGDEKDPDEADTVGATTLRKEHVTITENSIKFDFLGKDSIRWQEEIIAEGHDKQFQENLKKLMDKKKPKDDIFDGIRSRHVNQYYSGIVKGLSAKVFRTYLASNVVKNYLVNHDNIQNMTVNEKVYHGKLANLEAAMMCNHKRAIPKTFAESLQRRKDMLEDVKKQKAGEKAQAALKKTKATKPKTDAQKKKKTKRIRTLNAQIKNQKARHKERVHKLGLQIDLTEKTKDYSIGTSLKNYIDPRIYKAWTDEVGVDWEKLYSATLQKKFLWVKNENIKWKDFK